MTSIVDSSFLGLVIKLSGLFPLKPLVLLLCLGEDEVGHDEGREDDEDGLPDPPEGVGKTLGEGASKSLLLQGGNVVFGGASDGDAEVTESKSQSGE